MPRRKASGLGYLPFWFAPALVLVLAPLYLHVLASNGLSSLDDVHVLLLAALLLLLLLLSLLGCYLDAACRCPPSFALTLVTLQMVLVVCVLAVNSAISLSTPDEQLPKESQPGFLAHGRPKQHAPEPQAVQIASGKDARALLADSKAAAHEASAPHVDAPPLPPSKSVHYENHLKVPKDYRDEACRPQHKMLKAMPPGVLPNTSVIFTFCNEPEKSLFNSIYSVIERSPRHLLHEIILVSDGSDAPHLQKPLDDKVKTLPVPVKIVRTEHQGLMRARVAGARVATGDTITVLDSHISCSVGWLEPLMFRIHQGREHVVMPMIDGIDRNWNYKPGGVELVGFNTGLVDHGIRLQKAHDFPGRKATDPQPSPAMAGGLFSIHREYFWEIGAFDEGMLHWGGENIEIGFRVWQCGGRIELISCSRVAHLWGGMGANCPWKGASPGTVNKWRAIEVWMDPPHQELMRQFLPYPEQGTGDLTAMRSLRERLQCKSFDYFLETAYPECWMNLIHKSVHRGMLRNVGTRQCFNPRGHRGPKMEDCRADCGPEMEKCQQFLYLTEDSEILCNAHNADIDSCVEAGFSEAGPLSVYGCHGQKGNQEWTFDEASKVMKHGDLCLAADSAGKVFVSSNCNAQRPEVHWEWTTKLT